MWRLRPLVITTDSNFKQPKTPRGAVRPSCARAFPSKRGSRECRMRAAPAVSRAKGGGKCAHEHTGSAEAIRHSLRNGFTTYAALSPATNSSCHRRRRIWLVKPGWADFASANLTPATGARTTRFYRTQQHRSSARCDRSRETRPAITSRARRCRVHRIPSRDRDDHDSPLCG